MRAQGGRLSNRIVVTSVRILIVDRSEPHREMLRNRLLLIGFEKLAEADSPLAGLRLFRSIHPDLVFLDLLSPEAPDFGVVELFRTIRSESPATAVVVIGDQFQDFNASSFLAEGVIAYLEKAFVNYDQLAVTLRRLFPDLRPPVGGPNGKLRH